MNKTLTIVTGISFSVLLVGVGFVLGALAEMRYQENEGSLSHHVPADVSTLDGHAEDCAECAPVSEPHKRAAGYPGFTE